MDRGKLQLLATCLVSIEHLINNMKHPVSGRTNPESLRSDLMSVYEKGKVLVHINSVYIMINSTGIRQI